MGEITLFEMVYTGGFNGKFNFRVEENLAKSLTEEDRAELNKGLKIMMDTINNRTTVENMKRRGELPS